MIAGLYVKPAEVLYGPAFALFDGLIQRFGAGIEPGSGCFFARIHASSETLYNFFLLNPHGILPSEPHGIAVSFGGLDEGAGAAIYKARLTPACTDRPAAGSKNRPPKALTTTDPLYSVSKTFWRRRNG